MYSIEEIRKNLSADKDEPKFRRLGGMAKELKMILPEAYLSMEVLVGGKRILIPDKNGVMKEVVHQRSRSWVRNAYNHMFSQLAGVTSSSSSYNDSTYAAGKISIKDTGGTVRYASTVNYAGIGLGFYNASTFENWNNPTAGQRAGYLSAATEVTFGIVVGAGTNAESFEDYVLQTPIANGTTGDGAHLSYAQAENHATSYNAGALTFSNALARYMNNNTGVSVAVNEVALYVRGFTYTSEIYWCQSRDKLGSTVTVPNTGQLKVTYTISLVFAA